MKPRRPLPRQSKKRIRESTEYSWKKKAFLESHDHCFCCGLFIYTPTRDLHHLRGRSGKLFLDERFWEMACRKCHDAIHQNRKWAIENGFLGGPGVWGHCPPEEPQALGPSHTSKTITHAKAIGAKMPPFWEKP